MKNGFAIGYHFSYAFFFWYCRSSVKRNVCRQNLQLLIIRICTEQRLIFFGCQPGECLEIMDKMRLIIIPQIHCNFCRIPKAPPAVTVPYRRYPRWDGTDCSKKPYPHSHPEPHNAAPSPSGTDKNARCQSGS